MMNTIIRLLFTAIILTVTGTRGFCQTTIPEVLENGTLREQMNYISEKTRIYENYRAIREDMFQLIMRNAVDSLSKAQGQITILAMMNRNLVARIDSLTADIASLETKLDEAVRTKESIRILGMNINKNAYNSIMWIIIAILLFLLGFGFLIFKSNLSTMLRTKKDLEELKVEFEAYRQKKRIEIEKMGMDHFNEIRKLKGG
jgi:cell division protein FtsB